MSSDAVENIFVVHNPPTSIVDAVEFSGVVYVATRKSSWVDWDPVEIVVWVDVLGIARRDPVCGAELVVASKKKILPVLIPGIPMLPVAPVGPVFCSSVVISVRIGPSTIPPGPICWYWIGPVPPVNVNFTPPSTIPVAPGIDAPNAIVGAANPNCEYIIPLSSFPSVPVGPINTVPGPIWTERTRLSTLPTENVFVIDGMRSPLKIIAVPVDDSFASPIWIDPVATYKSFHLVPVEPRL